MAPNQEIELKLRVAPEQMTKIRRSRWWLDLEPGSRQPLHSVYFDTSEGLLRSRGITLRTRTEGGAIVQTVKLASDGLDTVSRREWETLVPDAIPDPSLIIDPALPQAFRKLDSTDLQPVFEVDVKRETRRLESDETKIDISLDEGVAIAGKRREHLHEIELELIDGDPEALFAEARRLSDAVDGRLHTRSKADLGHALTGDRRHWSRAPKLALAPDMTAGESFRLIVRSALSHLTANDDCARLNLHIEGVHQCRIALRRLRSALKTYGPLLRRKRIAPIEDEVRWLGRLLGTARDLDVLQADLLEPAMAALEEAEQLAPLVASLQAQKAIAYAQVAEALASARYRHLLIDLCWLGFGGSIAKSGDRAAALDQPLAGFAADALARAHRKLLKRGDGFATLSKTERHDVRISLKKLRYALDFFGSAFEQDGKKKFFKKLANLQEDLGRMNDVVVAETMIGHLIGVTAADGAQAGNATPSQLAFAAGGVLGWHRRRAAEIDVRLNQDWEEFVRAKPFWVPEADAAV